MKFDFNCILGVEADPTNKNRIMGQLPNDTKITVERHLNGWDVNLKIVVGDVVWHDNKIEPEEKPLFEKLRDKAFNRVMDIRDNHATNCRDAAAKYLLGKSA